MRRRFCRIRYPGRITGDVHGPQKREVCTISTAPKTGQQQAGVRAETRPPASVTVCTPGVGSAGRPANAGFRKAGCPYAGAVARTRVLAASCIVARIIQLAGPCARSPNGRTRAITQFVWASIPPVHRGVRLSRPDRAALRICPVGAGRECFHRQLIDVEREFLHGPTVSVKAFSCEVSDGTISALALAHNGKQWATVNNRGDSTRMLSPLSRR